MIILPPEVKIGFNNSPWVWMGLTSFVSPFWWKRVEPSPKCITPAARVIFASLFFSKGGKRLFLSSIFGLNPQDIWLNRLAFFTLKIFSLKASAWGPPFISVTQLSLTTQSQISPVGPKISKKSKKTVPFTALIRSAPMVLAGRTACCPGLFNGPRTPAHRGVLW